MLEAYVVVELRNIWPLLSCLVFNLVSQYDATLLINAFALTLLQSKWNSSRICPRSPKILASYL